MPKFAMYQTVRVVRVPPASAIWLGRLPSVGDTGAVIEIYSEPEELYLAEAVLPGGFCDWLTFFSPEDLELDDKPVA